MTGTPQTARFTFRPQAQPIAQVVEFDDVIGVRTEPAPSVRFCQNVYGVDPRTGELMWRIEYRVHSPYTNISRDGDALMAYNWDGWDDTVDRMSGKILASRFTK